ncbi:hypothetical protein Q7511_09730 [Glaesserella parasuis]|nr:hypothetical protein [Glaesserella parasuis]MDO9860770.1 hypothetical protein [Glaesserella parasuis]
MSEIVIKEGDLTFIFNEFILVEKYDDLSFDRNQFNAFANGTKAVDIIVVDENDNWMIEVKDYRQYQRTKTIPLADEIAIKVRDTLAGIVAMKLNANNQSEQQFAKQFLKKNKIKIVLHLEQKRSNSRLFPQPIDPAKLKQKLKMLLKAVDAHPFVVNKDSLHSTMHWKVI